LPRIGNIVLPAAAAPLQGMPVWSRQAPRPISDAGCVTRRCAVTPADPQPRAVGGPLTSKWAHLCNVLVATDFSETATQALERATRLPLAPNATVTVLHVVPFVARAADPPANHRAIGHAVSSAASMLARVGRHDVHVAARMGHGMPYVDVAWIAREWKHDLVVVGRHGQRRFRDELLGSTAEHVVHSCDTPVLVVALRQHLRLPWGSTPNISVGVCGDGRSRVVRHRLARRRRSTRRRRPRRQSHDREIRAGVAASATACPVQGKDTA